MADAIDLHSAHRHYHAGRLEMAEADCRRVLSRDPSDADALHLLGVVALQTGRHDDAVDLLRRAIGARPAFPDAFSNLAVALEARGQGVKAENACRAALRLEGYLETFGRIDVALDTFPFNGITTTCDCLWMGVPVVSLAGGTGVSRAGRSILSGAGIGHLATQDAYVSVAAALAADPGALAQRRAAARDRVRGSALCDAGRFTRELEAAYRAMWRRRSASR